MIKIEVFSYASDAHTVPDSLGVFEVSSLQAAHTLSRMMGKETNTHTFWERRNK